MPPAAMRDRHDHDNEITETDNGDGTATLECECGWIYTANNEFKTAVVLRHMREADLP
jgi:hypothetical protein